MGRLAFLVVLLGCGDNAPRQAARLEVVASTSHVAAGTEIQLSATLVYTDETRADVTATAEWNASDPQIVHVTNGVVDGLRPGVATITASQDGVSGTLDVTVTDAVVTAIVVTPPTASLPSGLRVQLAASATFSDGTTQDVTAQAQWMTSDATHATVAGGQVTGLTPGAVTITASLATIAGTGSITVTPAELVSLDITPKNAMWIAGYDQQFTATGTFTDASTMDLSTQVGWSTNDPTIATISSSGLAHALKTGDVAVTAMLGSTTANTTAHVTPAVIVSIAIGVPSPSLAKGFDEPLTAMATFSDGTMQDLTDQVTWSSSATGVATVSNANGSYGLVASVDLGTTTITATSGAISANAMISVTAATLTSITISPDPASLPKGTRGQLTATGTFSDSSTLDLTTQVAWSTASSAVATISNVSGSQGEAFALAQGSTQVTATSGSIVGTSQLDVTPAVLVSIAIAPANTTLPVGFARTLAAIGTYTDGSTRDISAQATWSSSAASVVSITANGTATANAMGTATISASSAGITGTTSVTATSAKLISIAVSPAMPSIVAGDTLALTATGNFNDSSTLDLTTQVTWASADSATATVSSQGVVTAVAQGSTSISASSGNIVGSAAVTVTAAEIDVVFDGNGAGEVAIVSGSTTVAVCVASCSITVSTGTYTLDAATPEDWGGMTGACNTTADSCTVTASGGHTIVHASFTKPSKEKWSKLLFPGEEILSAAYDSAGNLIVGTAAHVGKLDGSGNLLWSLALEARQVAIGPGDVIDIASCTTLTQLGADGVTAWSVTNTAGCPTYLFEPRFSHWMAVSSSGQIVAYGSNLASWSSTGTALWTLSVPGPYDFSAVAIDSAGVSWVPVDNVGSVNLQSVSNAGALLSTVLHPVSGADVGMLAVDPADHLITATGYTTAAYLDRRSEADVRDFSTVTSVPGSPDAVGAVALATGEIGWTYGGDQDQFGDAFTLVRFAGDGSTDATYSRAALAGIGPGGTQPVGVRRDDIAGDASGDIALVGGYTNSSAQLSGWIEVFAP